MDFNKNYNSIKIYNNSKKPKFDQKTKRYNISLKYILDINFAVDTKTKSNFDNFYNLYISSKQTQTVIYKLMTKVKEKLEKVYIDLLRLPNSLLLLGNK